MENALKSLQGLKATRFVRFTPGLKPNLPKNQDNLTGFLIVRSSGKPHGGNSTEARRQETTVPGERAADYATRRFRQR
jgi:hypothetical protein